MKIGEMVFVGKNKKGKYLGSEMTPFGLYHRVELKDGTNLLTAYCRPTKDAPDQKRARRKSKHLSTPAVSGG